MNEYIVSRNVTRKECGWLEKDVKAGTKVYVYTGCTYGCITPDGTAVTLVPNQLPFFELPNDSLKMIVH
jgi:hypothetical protein